MTTIRDIFTEIFEHQPLDPMEAARRNVRPLLRKRFYERAGIGEADGQYQVLLDGRPVRTPARGTLAAPSERVASAIAEEWAAQEGFVDPARMPLTRLANSIVDGVARSPQPVAAEVERYLGSDLLFYRAQSPQGLVEMQARHWDPVMAWARDALGARFVMAEGVTFVRQEEGAVAAAARALPRDPWRLGAVNSATSLTGSALLALALAHGRIDAAAAWAAAHVDEDWNMAAWGRDALELERRGFRRRELDAAAVVLDSLR